MTRIKRGVTSHQKHRKILASVKGFRGRQRTNFKLAKIASLKAKIHATRDRKLKKRTFRGLWIARINAALKQEGIRYGDFMKKIKEKHIQLDRKALSHIAAIHPSVFKKIVDTLK